ncbi:MAG: transcription termination/antitermination protein NusG [Elusimicrobiota bacterium]
MTENSEDKKENIEKDEEVAAVVKEDTAVKKNDDPNMKWYIIHTRTSFEYKVKNNIEHAIETQSMKEKFVDIVIPTEDVVELKKNKKHIKKRKFFPGYILIKMLLDNQTYWVVRSIAGVTGFLGGLKPTPLREAEVAAVLNAIEVPSGAKPKPAIIFEKDETVRIIDGPFANFIGVVEDVNHEKGKLKVMVTIFGRSTPVELDFLQVEKM